MKTLRLPLGSFAVLLALAGFALAHGDGAPQPVDTAGLPAMGEDWKAENPFRKADAKLKETAIEVGSRGYNSNCARCHGIEVVSGGIAPDIRFLEPNADGDIWFLQRIRKGAVVNDRQKMPPFEGLLSQEAMWAIRTYVESRPQE